MASNKDFTGEESELEEEVGVLKEIYNELEVHKNDNGGICGLSLLLHPATGDQVELKWVCLTLVLTLPQGYPDEAPEIQIKNPRGLAEGHVSSLQQELEQLAEDRRGDCMMFELIELAKESLTQGNIPHGECVICKDDFSGTERFTKTECYHYFHCHCLLHYIEHSERELEEEYETAMQHSSHMNIERKQVVCPVCRDPFLYDLTQLQSYPAPNDLDPSTVTLSPTVLLIQHQMAAMFQRQKDKGGIIDVEAEKNKFLVTADSFHILSSLLDTTSNSGQDTDLTLAGDIAMPSTVIVSDPDEPASNAGPDSCIGPDRSEPQVTDDMEKKDGICIIIGDDDPVKDCDTDIKGTSNDVKNKDGTTYHESSSSLTNYHTKSNDNDAKQERTTTCRQRDTENYKQRDGVNRGKYGRVNYHRDVNSRDRYRRDKRDGYRDTGYHGNKSTPRGGTRYSDDFEEDVETKDTETEQPKIQVESKDSKFESKDKPTDATKDESLPRKASHRNNTRSHRYRGYDRNDYYDRGYHGNDRYHSNKGSNRKEPEDWHDDLLEDQEVSIKQNRNAVNHVSVTDENVGHGEKLHWETERTKRGRGGRGNREYYDGYKHGRKQHSPRDGNYDTRKHYSPRDGNYDTRKHYSPRDGNYGTRKGRHSPADDREDWQDSLMGDDEMGVSTVDTEQKHQGEKDDRSHSGHPKERDGYRDRGGRSRYTSHKQTRTTSGAPSHPRHNPRAGRETDGHYRDTVSKDQSENELNSRDVPVRHKSYKSSRRYRAGPRDDHDQYPEADLEACGSQSYQDGTTEEKSQDPPRRQNSYRGRGGHGYRHSPRDSADVTSKPEPELCDTQPNQDEGQEQTSQHRPSHQHTHNRGRGGYRNHGRNREFDGQRGSGYSGRYKQTENQDDRGSDQVVNHDERPVQNSVQDVKSYAAKSPDRMTGNSDNLPTKKTHNQISSCSYTGRGRSQYYQHQTSKSDKNDVQSRPRAENHMHKYSDHHYSNRREVQRRYHGKTHENKLSKSEEAVS